MSQKQKIAQKSNECKILGKERKKMAKFSFNEMKEKLKGNVIKENSSYEDERIWKLSADENGNGSALVRLLPGPIVNGELTPAVVRVVMHEIFLKDNQGKWRIYKEKSPQTIGGKCPVTEAFFELKEAAKENPELEELAKKLQRRNKIYMNILVKKDLQNKDNNGKIFIWETPKSIWDACLSVLDPSEQERELGKKPKELFDLQEGCDLVISRRGKKLDTTYTVEFQDPTPLCSPEEEEKYLSKVYDLSEFIDPKTFKSYDELKEKFHKTIAGTELEDILIAIGSKVITEKYTENSSNTKSGASTYTPKAKTNTPKVEEPKVETSAPKEAPAVSQSVANDEDIDDLLDDL